jgi:hypothetical protein
VGRAWRPHSDLPNSDRLTQLRVAAQTTCSPGLPGEYRSSSQLSRSASRRASRHRREQVHQVVIRPLFAPPCLRAAISSHASPTVASKTEALSVWPLGERPTAPAAIHAPMRPVRNNASTRTTMPNVKFLSAAISRSGKSGNTPHPCATWAETIPSRLDPLRESDLQRDVVRYAAYPQTMPMELLSY